MNESTLHKDRKMKGFAIFGAVIGFLLLIALSSILNGYALSVLWGWFMVPTFGVPELSIVAAIGIALIVRYLTYDVSTSKKKDDRTAGEQLVTGIVIAVLYPALVLSFGWIVQIFM